MTKYKTKIDEKTGITFVDITGNIDLDGQAAFLNSESYGERTSCVVADMRNASLGSMTRGTIVKLLRTFRPLSKPGIRVAYVFNKGEDFSKGKLMLAQQEVLGYEGKFKLFTDLEKAISWVQR